MREASPPGSVAELLSGLCARQRKETPEQVGGDRKLEGESQVVPGHVAVQGETGLIPDRQQRSFYKVARVVKVRAKGSEVG